MTKFGAIALIAIAASISAQPLTPVPTKDQKIIKRWELPGDPHGVAVGADGTIYAGLAKPQAVVAIDPKSGAIKKRIVLDSAEIASTKELVTMRTNRAGTRLYIANGSDESATIMSIPDLAVLREITMEGEAIRDAVPDPKGRYLYLLGRHVHVFDINGEKELRTISIDDPMAIAPSANGTLLAVIATEDFGNTKATSAAFFDTTNFAEAAREPLQTDKVIEAALFGANDQALIALSRDALFEKPLSVAKPAPSKSMTPQTDGKMRMAINFGDLTSSETICLPEGSGAQIAALASPELLVFAERRCSGGGSFIGSERRVSAMSLYGVAAYAVAFDRNTLIVTDRAGFLTIYKAPRPGAK